MFQQVNGLPNSFDTNLRISKFDSILNGFWDSGEPQKDESDGCSQSKESAIHFIIPRNTGAIGREFRASSAFMM